MRYAFSYKTEGITGKTRKMDEPLIRLHNLSKSFGTNQVLNKVNLSIFKGEITAIIGKSGVGKSVLLKHIIGLISYDSGEVLFEGKSIKEMSREERVRLKDRFSYMFQGNALFDSLSVFDNVGLPLKEKTRMKKKKIRNKVEELLEKLDLKNIGNKYPSELSGGMQKRVALARALVTDPEIVLFDEPTTGLDPIRKNAVHQMITDYKQQFGFTGVVVSHEIPDIFFIARRVSMIEEGKIIFEGTPEEIQRSDNPAVHMFVRGTEPRHDALTGIAPQSRGIKRFHEESARLSHDEEAFSLIILTVENKRSQKVHELYESNVTALQVFAKEIRQHLREFDFCSRYGSNKIMVLLPQTDRQAAGNFCKDLADKLIRARRDKDSFAGKREYGYSVVAGIAEARRNRPIEEIVRDADSNRNVFYEFDI